MVAPVAIQMGRAVARNIIRQLGGRPLEPFRYRDQGTLATIAAMPRSRMSSGCRQADS